MYQLISLQMANRGVVQSTQKKRFMIEDPQLETVPTLQKLTLISLQVALQVMVLKLSFDKEDEKLSSKIYFISKESIAWATWQD